MSKFSGRTFCSAEQLRRRERVFPWFLLATLLPILVMPFSNMAGNPLQRLVLGLAALHLVIQSLRLVPEPAAGVNLLGGRGFYRALGIYAGIAMFVPVFLGHHSSSWMHMVILVGVLGFYFVTAIRIIQMLSLVEGVNTRVLCLGAAGYVHLGLTAGQAATFLEVMRPGSFHLGVMLPGEELLERLNYYAFVTMGSIGYGDVLPVTPLAEFYAVAVSLAGTLYVSLMIGLLLSRYINDQADAMKQARDDEGKSKL
jgi:voltage-gated potassium channel